ncbi:hypothetical protein ATO6_06085 [Oceanicola sp. 22II-s10i]|uniref:hypothetical protein n=1 Tax=Oceanicola sp. 22II-s10i TaxID=1317116 RepID=UPI000B51ECB2|nr:hypothetical protein [Oceanicola sp. 22II-s10i]OWU86385.1 hypothetical protein ATO6_06085 [Oceanicola sp. 22II-s10i]
MSRPALILGLLILWIVLCALSIIVPANTAPTDFGFTRGMNRVTLFFQFQALGLFVAIALWSVSRRAETPLLRWAGRVPILIALLGVVALIGVILWARYADPINVAPPPDRPATALAPAAPATD